MKKLILYGLLVLVVLAAVFILNWQQPVLVPWYHNLPQDIKLVLMFLGGVVWSFLFFSFTYELADYVTREEG